jgi:hypothetical protein
MKNNINKNYFVPWALISGASSGIKLFVDGGMAQI